MRDAFGPRGVSRRRSGGSGFSVVLAAPRLGCPGPLAANIQFDGPHHVLAVCVLRSTSKLIDVEAHRACAPMTLIRPKIRPPRTVSDGPWARSMLSIAQDHRVTRSVSSSAGCRPASVSRGKRFSISASNLRLTGELRQPFT